MIKISDTAADEIHRLLTSNSKPEWGLRVGVKAGGCSGMEYTMAFDSAAKEDDHVFESNGVKVFVDLRSYLYLGGMELDYTTELVGGGFKFRNPNAVRTCSCGTSFSA